MLSYEELMDRLVSKPLRPEGLDDMSSSERRHRNEKSPGKSSGLSFTRQAAVFYNGQRIIPASAIGKQWVQTLPVGLQPNEPSP